MYNPTHWLDHIVDQETGEVVQQGTDETAGKFNNMEHGISDVSIALALSMIASRQSEA